MALTLKKLKSKPNFFYLCSSNYACNADNARLYVDNAAKAKAEQGDINPQGNARHQIVFDATTDHDKDGKNNDSKNNSNDISNNNINTGKNNGMENDGC